MWEFPMPNHHLYTMVLAGVNHQVSICGTICWSSWMHQNVPLCRPAFSKTGLAVYEFEWQKPEPNGFAVWCWHGDSRKWFNIILWVGSGIRMTCGFKPLSIVMPGLYLYMPPSHSKDSASSCATGRWWWRVASTLCFEVFVMGSNKCWNQFSFSM